MASGTITIDYSSAWKGYLSYSTTSNIASNTSSVTVSLYMKKNDGYATGGNGAWAASLTIGGSSKDITTANGYVLYQEYDCIGTYTKSVSHNSDGTGSVYISGSVTGPSGTSLAGKTMSGGATITLDKIPRGSSISGTSNVYFGSACSVTWTPLATTFYYKLKFSLGSWSYTTAGFKPGTTSSYTYTGYTIPLTAANQIPNSTSGVISVSLYSYDSSSCSTQIGSTSTASFTATLPDNVVPTISACTASISNSNSVVAGWGIALAGYSKVSLSATASGVYGSTISSFSITGSYTVTVTGSSLDYTGDVITSSGNKEFIVKCTDSRGRVSQKFTTNAIQFLSYTPPKVKQLSMSKDTKDDDNAANDRMIAVSTWEIDSVNGNNNATAKIYYKVSSATDWIVHSGTLTNGVAFELTDLVPDELLSYNFKVVVTDTLGNSAEKDTFASTTQVLMDFRAGGKGLGIGKISEQDAMEVSMKSIFYNDIYIGNNETTLATYIDDRIPTDLAKNSDVSAVNDRVTSLSSTVSTLSTAVNSKIEIKLLWTNGSPTSSFASQTISVSLSAYTHIGIIFKQAYSVNYYFPMAIYQKGLPGTYAGHSDGTLTRRNITSISNSGVTFSGGLYYDEDMGSEQASNGSVVPYKIYGIKGVS